MDINSAFKNLKNLVAAEESNNSPIKYEALKWSLVFQTKDAISYAKLGQDKTPQSLYKAGDSFSEKGDNFQWIYVAIGFAQVKGSETKEGTYTRQLNGWGGLEGTPDIFGVELDPQDVRLLESALGMFDGPKIAFPLTTKTGSAELTFYEPKSQVNMMKFSAKMMSEVLSGKKSMPGFLKYDLSGFGKQFTSMSYRLVGTAGKLTDVFRQPVDGFKGTAEQVFNTNKGKEIDTKEAPIFEPVNQQNKKLEEKKDIEKQGSSKESAISGGFDILQRLVEEQRKKMPLRESSSGEEKESAVGMSNTSTSSKSKTDTSDPASAKKLQKYHSEVSKAYGQMSKNMENIQRSLSQVQASDKTINRVLEELADSL